MFDLQLEVAEPPRGFEPLPGPHAQDGPTRTDHTADEQGEDAAQRAARRLHTELGQTLAALRWEIDLLDAQADPAAPEDCARALGLVDRAMTELRSLVDDLHPPELDDLGLVAAVRGLVLRARRRTPIRLELTIRDEDRLEQIDADMALGVFRLVQDALDGVIRLAAAQAVHIGIEIDPVDGLVLLFRNIGSRHGRPDAQVPDPLPAVERLQRRAARLDGVVELTSATAGETLILLKLPLVLRANVVAEQDDHPVVKNATGELR